MSTRNVVLDACVLVPAALRDTLLRAAEKGLYYPRWSHQILAEVERALIHMRNEADARKVVSAMRVAFPEATTRIDQHTIDEMTNHPKDRHVAATAVVTQASVIVTDNLRDFPASALAPYQITAQPPDALLVGLFSAHPELLNQVITEQAAATHRPPLSPSVILDHLAIQHAPRFVELVRARMRTGQVE